MSIVLLPVAFLFSVVLQLRSTGLRRSVLQGGLIFSMILVVLTETLSVARALSLFPVAFAWTAVCFCEAVVIWKLGRAQVLTGAIQRIRECWAEFGGIEKLCLASIAAILVPVAIAARLGAPNGVDAMGYHLPRIVFWAQAHSVEFFPTDFPQQLFFQPFGEYLMLHTWLLSGGDVQANLVQWGAFAGCIVAASLIAQRLGAGTRGQTLAAFFAATIPNAVLQASGTKNDLVLSVLLMSMVYFALCYVQEWRGSDQWAAGAALSLALLTKGTAYLYIPALLSGIILGRSMRAACLIRTAGVFLLSILALNGPHYLRCIAYSGSPLGLKSVYSNGEYRFANDRVGVLVTVSNILRNLALHFNDFELIHRVVLRAHNELAIDVNDEATTWTGTRFRQMEPYCDTHEGCAPSRWHVLSLFLAGAVLLCTFRRVRRDWITLYAGVAGMFILFCALLRWQPWHARMHVVILMAGAGLVGVCAATFLRARAQAIVCVLFLLPIPRLLLGNYHRAFYGPDSMLAVTRDQQYFQDFDAEYQEFRKAAELIASAGCDRVGIDTSYDARQADFRRPPLEYPLMLLIRQVRPNAKFIHTGVSDPSARYSLNTPFRDPCAIVCLVCGGNAAKAEKYRDKWNASVLGKAVVFLPVTQALKAQKSL